MTRLIEAIGVGKDYVRSSVRRGGHHTLRDAMADWGRRIVDRATPRQRRGERFAALKQVSFELHEGEVLGIVGPNGSGKSTLLKIISAITVPTRGEIRIAGSVGSLLEVGTGFHPELTGRENVYLNGAIIGMSRAEVQRKFDAIVAFSGVESFIDTPVKRYSSGMQVRLAFAIAAHIEPDVLILDEVLAVGDASFQRKCMEKLKEIGKSDGRAVILVSHSMAAIRSMCTKALLLDGGEVKAYGQVEDVIGRYQGQSDGSPGNGRVDLTDWKNRSGVDGSARITWAEIRPDGDHADEHLSIGDTMRLTFGCQLAASHVGKPMMLGVWLSTADGTPIAFIIDKDSKFAIDDAKPEEVVSLVFRDIRFYPGLYTVSLWVGSRDAEPWDDVRECITFEVKQGGAVARRPLVRRLGVLFLTPEWERA